MREGHISRDRSQRVAVCLITYRRPEGLRRLLENLNRLTFEKCEPPDLEVIVVDNDQAGFACEFCEGLASDFNWPLRCFVEPRRGIPFARNTSVARALEGGADFVAFIDDDEVPEPPWLDELLCVQASYGADLVSGPVLPRFVDPPEPWIEAGSYFDRKRYATGKVVPFVRTSNALVSTGVFEGLGLPFDESLALSGGSDREFGERAGRAGFRSVWADEAMVHEWVPPSRANLQWLLRRHYRYGNTYGFVVLKGMSSPRLRFRLAAKAVGRIGRLSARVLRRLPQFLVVKPRPLGELRQLRSPVKVVLRGQLVNPLLHAAWEAGVVAAAVGSRYEEYRKPHGV